MTVDSFDPNQEVVTLTAKALRHFERAVAAKESAVLRLSTKVSGCTGYAYVLDLVTETEADDAILKPSDKLTLAVAADALKVLRGTEIDYVLEGVNSVVKFNNPNVVAECGCGESFSVA